MRRFFRFISQLITLALILVLLTIVWIVLDGVSDAVEKSDVALFAPNDGDDINPQLDHLAELYKDEEIPQIILCEKDEAADRAHFASNSKYLVEHGVPAEAIATTSYVNTWDLAQKVTEVMKMHEYGSVMLVTDYYRMTRLKIALRHEGVTVVRKSHLGTAHWEDIVPIGWEVVALYDYVGKTFLLPAAEKIKQEAKVGVDKVKEDAHDAKKSVDHGLDNLSK